MTEIEEFEETGRQTLNDVARLRKGCQPAISDSQKKRLDNLQPRAKLNEDLAYWGLTFNQMCTLRSHQLEAVTSFRSRRQELRERSDSGDSVAMLLLSIRLFQDWYELAETRDEAFAMLRDSAELGNPVALANWLTMKNLAGQELSASTGTSLLNLRETNCAAVFYTLARMAKGDFGKVFSSQFSSGNLAEFRKQAIEYGSRDAMCDRYFELKSNTWSPENSHRLNELSERMERSQETCHKLFEAMGGVSYWKTWSWRGSCKRNDFNCLRSSMMMLSKSGERAAYFFLAQTYLESEVGGDWKQHSNKGVKALEQASELGYSQAFGELGLLHAFGQYGLERNAAKARKYCERGAYLQEWRSQICMAFLADTVEEEKQLAITAEKNVPCSAAYIAQERIDRSIPFTSFTKPNALIREIKKDKEVLSELRKDRSKLQFLLNISTLINDQCLRRNNFYLEVFSGIR